MYRFHFAMWIDEEDAKKMAKAEELTDSTVYADYTRLASLNNVWNKLKNSSYLSTYCFIVTYTFVVASWLVKLGPHWKLVVLPADILFSCLLALIYIKIMNIIMFLIDASLMIRKYFIILEIIYGDFV